VVFVSVVLSMLVQGVTLPSVGRRLGLLQEPSRDATAGDSTPSPAG